MKCEVSVDSGGSIDETCRYLLPEELAIQAQSDFNDLVEQRRYTSEQIGTFVLNNVLGVRRNGYNILFVNTDADSPDPEVAALNPLAVEYMNAENTIGIFPEYFHFELRQHAGVLSRRMRKAQEGNEIKYSDRRLRLARDIEYACAASGKPIIAADIANKPSYMVACAGITQAPTIAAAIAYSLNAPWWTLSVGVASSAIWLGANTRSLRHGKGIYDSTQVSSRDRLTPDFEQARRLFMARAIAHITNTPAVHDNPNTRQQLVVLDPRAHGMRIADILVRPNEPLDKAQAAMYRTLAPWLDTKPRIYKPGNAPQANSQEWIRAA